MGRFLIFVTAALLTGCWGAADESPGEQGQLFRDVPAGSTGIDFENKLAPSSLTNIITYPHFYNGGGVAAGDINNDGLIDLYFSSNQWQNKLYLNQGKFKFKDINESAKVTGSRTWKAGVTMADVNGDGWLDIYVCGVNDGHGFNGHNELFINNRDLTFKESSQEYGLAYQGLSAQAAFFDYDNDGDLDMYLANHSADTDKLFRNDLIPTGKAYFVDVTSAAGISGSAGVAVAVSDVNNDGYSDLYISNNGEAIDHLYINKGDATFRQVHAMAHTSRFTTGNDMADINDDGWNDVVTLDRFPSEERLVKTSVGKDAFEFEHYQNQLSRNTMQINLGAVDKGDILFSDVAPIAGMAATDWSWAPLVADFDNDGVKDLFVTTGIVGKPNDLDYKAMIAQDTAHKLSDQEKYSKMPDGTSHSRFFKGSGNLVFSDVSATWSGTTPALSAGAVYADLDNDGDLDLAINNVNAKATLLRNSLDSDSSNYVNIALDGLLGNRFGIGASLKVYAGRDQFFREQYSTRGWMSSVSNRLHIGLGAHEEIDSLIVIWPGGRFQKLTKVKVNELLTLKQADADKKWNYSVVQNTMLKRDRPISHKHIENNFNTMSVQRLIPHANSMRGPKVSVGDLNGDRIDDLYVCGGQGQSGVVYIQTRAGKFVAIPQPAFEIDIKSEETCSLLFDADGDKDLDLMVGSGGEEFLDRRLLVRLYLNNGRGVFTKTDGALQKFYVNASCLAAADVDQDKDMDVFVGGGVVTGRYGMDSDSFILINDGHGLFKESPAIFDGKKRPGGMVQAGVWADLNNDQFPDLVTAGEWMTVSVWMNTEGVLKREESNGLDSTFGIWNSLVVADMDKDGDLDIIAGSIGLNTRIQLVDNEPLKLIVLDLDQNSRLDQLISFYDRGVRYPLTSRDQLVGQIPVLAKKYRKYSDYSKTTINQLATGRRNVERLVNSMASTYFENKGSGKFEGRPLPMEAQLFPVMAMSASDINGDGHADLLLAGNINAVQPELWRHDAGYGLALLGDGKGNFRSVDPKKSGFVVKGEARDIQLVHGPLREEFYIAVVNNDSLLTFKKQH